MLFKYFINICGIITLVFSIVNSIKLVWRNTYLIQKKSDIILKVIPNRREGFFLFVISILGLFLIRNAFFDTENSWIIFIWITLMMSNGLVLINSLSCFYILEEGLLFSNHLLNWLEIGGFNWEEVHTGKNEKLTIHVIHKILPLSKKLTVIVPFEDKEAIEKILLRRCANVL